VRRQLATTAAAVTVTIVLAFCVPLALVVRVVAHDRAVHPAELESRSLAAVLAGTRDPAVLDPIVGQANASGARRAIIALPDGRQIGAGPLPDDDLARARTGVAFTSETADGVSVFVPVENVDGTSVVRVFVPHEELERGVHAAWLALGVLAFALIAMSVALADRIGRSMVRPMQHLRDVAHRLQRGDRDARAQAVGPAEVVEVATAVNGLADRIDDLLAAEREAAADVSHRLRTPLTALRLDIEQLDDTDPRRRLLADVSAVESAVDDVIRATRSAARVEDPVVDLTDVVRVRLGFWTLLAENQHREITLDIDDVPRYVRASRNALEATVDALIGNVFRHTPPGTSLRVALEAPATLVIEDEGPGLPDASLVSRGASNAGSTGLGLDIARRTVEGAGGHLDIERRAGRGLRVALVFPSAVSSASVVADLGRRGTALAPPVDGVSLRP